MKTYRVSFKYSTNQGKSWISTSTTIKAESDQGAIMQVESKYEYVKDIKITDIR
ncbi:hypothetical protein [Fusobacterium varium]|uniref:hypothetical protein n=1 Tax=Fusobacterium varium TaxID=856 RepID=UPI00242E8651|nr:hypothetical protein [Fusobacterium varium]MCF0171574.1 hypothetical protein [Fusobacterium varium]